MKIPVQIIFMYCVIRYLELLMEYAEVHQQQETWLGTQKNSSTVGID